MLFSPFCKKQWFNDKFPIYDFPPPSQITSSDYLYRFHNAHAIEFNSQRGGISLETEKTADGTTSRLLLTRAEFRDGGNYSCVPHGALQANAFVHVLNGELYDKEYLLIFLSRGHLKLKWKAIRLLICNTFQFQITPETVVTQQHKM